MAVRGIGVDVVKVDRLVDSLERFGKRLENRLFTDAELEYCRRHKNPIPHLAARFAAKEAAFKALGTGWNQGVAWREVEVGHAPGGRPTLSFTGAAAEHAARLGMKRASLSLSHTKEQAVAQVILED